MAPHLPHLQPLQSVAKGIQHQGAEASRPIMAPIMAMGKRLAPTFHQAMINNGTINKYGDIWQHQQIWHHQLWRFHPFS